jgi:ABC-type phosphate transport system substrate-binding protein
MKKIIICLLVLAGLSSGTALADILIIANRDVPDAELSRKDVGKMFLGKLRQWSDHSKVNPVTPRVPDVREAFFREYLNKSVAKYNAYWKRMIFTGRGVPPKAFETEAELVEYVAETGGAIGCVSSEGIPDGSKSMIRIIKIK